MRSKIFFGILIVASLCGCSTTTDTILAATDSKTTFDSASAATIGDPLDTQLKLYPVKDNPALDDLNISENQDDDVFKPIELISPQDKIKANEIANMKEVEEFKPVPAPVIKEIKKKANEITDIKTIVSTDKFKQLPEPIIKAVKKIESSPAHTLAPTPAPASAPKDDRCSDGETFTLMKNGEFACCPKGGKVCYPLLKPIAPKPIVTTKIKTMMAAPIPKVQPINKTLKCATNETLTKMSTGEFACCPSSEAVCYPVLE